MNDTRYAPPTAAVADQEPEARLERPPIVVLAVRMLWAGFAVSFVTAIYGLFNLPDNVPKTIVVGATLLGLAISATVSFVVFSAAWRGRNWARWFIGSLIVLAIGGVALLWSRYPPVASIPWQTTASFIVRMALYISAVMMLFSPVANAWYREKKNGPF